MAVEIDGETYHNPNKVSNEKYYDDLLKQNSLIHENWKVYRWTYKQLKDHKERVKDQLVTFLGEFPTFKEIEDFLPKQKGKILELKEHQKQALDNLKAMRENGESIALLYHATGTGKTVTAVEDAKIFNKRTLFIAHTDELINQAENTFKSLWKDKSCGVFKGDRKEKESFILCATIQSMNANLKDFSPEDFKYIIIDEAHHGAAETYRKLLSYFKPEFTLGLTATPERSDGESILELFKNVAHKLDLKTAVEIGELVPIRCIRVKTNVDLQSVRINGIKYNSSDLESKLYVPDRNNLIVDTYLEYVKNKKTVVFCASVKHAEEVAGIFRTKGVRAEAVSGYLMKRDRENILKEYEYGDLNVLCACDLLNEGWDSPRTEALFMARPTMSKTIYLQQLGRGTRKSEGKECLMVFDFIDNAGLFNMPLSVHRLFNMDKYVPGSLVLGSKKDMLMEDDLIRRGEKPAAYLDFPVSAYDYEYIGLFNWQNEVKDLISEREFVRRVYVQEGAIADRIKKGLITPDFQVPMINKTFNYFKEESIEKYANEFEWELITAANMKDKFIDFVSKMTMAYSYKPVLLKAMLEYANDKGKVLIEDIVDYFIDFYEDRKNKGLIVEKPKSPYCKDSYTRKEIEKNIFSNPFDKYEQMNSMKKSKDVEYVEFNSNIWKKLTNEDKKHIEEICDKKLEEYFKKLEA
ncbi:superfamily II DNA or RNA helicase [Clostridium pascui]|uniref:DEAD/DEAH box helicase n=1 Tax=Clostridium pascui TaxID=46609 RepID=UPI00311CAC70|nr:superfamily II DNA or RNA helicase [Clostridium pascui]